MSLSTFTSVVLTYATHSFAACAIGFVVARGLHRPRDRDILWKTIFVAPWLTTAFALVLANGLPFWPALDLGGVVRRLWSNPLPGRSVVLKVYKLAGETSINRTVTDPVDRTLSIVVSCIAAVCIAVALCRVIARYRALSRRIVDRSVIQSEANDVILSEARDLGPRSRSLASLRMTPSSRPFVTLGMTDVLLTTCDKLPSPIALGRNEICLPRFVAFDFDEPRRSALIAHEAAHLARRDPFWFAFIDTIVAVSAFQPLSWQALRAFRHNAELMCDEMAVRATGDRVALIGALAALASPFDELLGAPAALSTSARRPLLARAERIASVDLHTSTLRSRTVWLVAIACFVALAAVPTVRPDPRDPPLPRDMSTMSVRAERGARRWVESIVVRRSDRRIVDVDSTISLPQ